jgi:hypothetical protein
MLLSAVLPRQRSLLRPRRNIAEVAVSLDGHWVASGTWVGTQVKVWDTTTGTLAADLPGSDAMVGSSPDGRWLVAGHWTLEINVKFEYPFIGFDWLVLAMSHQRMGQTDRAIGARPCRPLATRAAEPRSPFRRGVRNVPSRGHFGPGPAAWAVSD